jgi:hypothetical protein
LLLASPSMPPSDLWSGDRRAVRKKAVSLFKSISIAHLLSFSLGIAERRLRVSRAVPTVDHLQSNTCAHSYHWGGVAYPAAKRQKVRCWHVASAAGSQVSDHSGYRTKSRMILPLPKGEPIQKPTSPTLGSATGRSPPTMSAHKCIASARRVAGKISLFSVRWMAFASPSQ